MKKFALFMMMVASLGLAACGGSSSSSSKGASSNYTGTATQATVDGSNDMPFAATTVNGITIALDPSEVFDDLFDDFLYWNGYVLDRTNESEADNDFYTYEGGCSGSIMVRDIELEFVDGEDITDKDMNEVIFTNYSDDCLDEDSDGNGPDTNGYVYNGRVVYTREEFDTEDAEGTESGYDNRKYEFYNLTIIDPDNAWTETDGVYSYVPDEDDEILAVSGTITSETSYSDDIDVDDTEKRVLNLSYSDTDYDVDVFWNNLTLIWDEVDDYDVTGRVYIDGEGYVDVTTDASELIEGDGALYGGIFYMAGADESEAEVEIYNSNISPYYDFSIDGESFDYYYGDDFEEDFEWDID